MMISRHLAASLQRSRKSVLLLGPRQTGKSTLVGSLRPVLTVNLAHEPTYLQFARNPAELEQRLAAARPPTVFLDEIQRLPSVLNTIQALLDQDRGAPKFYLTGSSARKLRRGQANLLPGRIHTYHLGPLVASELGYRMDAGRALATGTLPGIWTEADAHERRTTLQTYAATYVKEEVQAEALTRNIEGFARFVFVLAAASGTFLDLSKLAAAAEIPRQSAMRFVEVLEDTLLLRRCEAFRTSTRRRLIQHPRVFFFDTGVLNGLLNNFVPSGDRVGGLFEHLLFNQLLDSAAAHEADLRLSSYRTEHGAEVDFIVERGRDTWAVEAKASERILHLDLRGFRSFAAYYGKRHRAVVAYLGTTRKAVQGIEVLPWQALLKDLGL